MSKTYIVLLLLTSGAIQAAETHQKLEVNKPSYTTFCGSNALAVVSQQDRTLQIFDPEKKASSQTIKINNPHFIKKIIPDGKNTFVIDLSGTCHNPAAHKEYALSLRKPKHPILDFYIDPVSHAHIVLYSNGTLENNNPYTSLEIKKHTAQVKRRLTFHHKKDAVKKQRTPIQLTSLFTCHNDTHPMRKDLGDFLSKHPQQNKHTAQAQMPQTFKIGAIGPFGYYAYDKQIILQNRDSDKKVSLLKESDAQALEIVFHPHMPILAAILNDNSIALWSSETQNIVAKISEEDLIPKKISFGQDGTLLVIFYNDDGKVRLYDPLAMIESFIDEEPATASCQLQHPGIEGEPAQGDINPSGTFVALRWNNKNNVLLSTIPKKQAPSLKELCARVIATKNLDTMPIPKLIKENGILRTMEVIYKNNPQENNSTSSDPPQAF